VLSLIRALILPSQTDEDGQGLAEYALILALIAIVAILALLFLGSQISTILSRLGTSI
jgi:pilus assembly protein Flp/PilA